MQLIRNRFIRAGVKIRVRRYPTGRTKFVVDCGIVDGKRLQLAFDARKDAEAELRSRAKMRRQTGQIGHSLSPAALARYALAEERLSEAGMSIEEAVTLALAHGRALKRKLSVAELVKEFVASRRSRATPGRDMYVNQLNVSLGNFAAELRGRDVGSVTRQDVSGWLFGSGWASKTIKNYAGNVRTMFNWAMREGLASRNPSADIELPKQQTEKEVSVLSPAQCARLLRLCAFERGPLWHPGRLAWEGNAFRFDDLLGYVAVTLFCGVRPEEVKRSTRADLDLENGTFVVGSAVDKNARRRVVELSPVAVAWMRIWLERHPKQRAFKPANWRKKWEKLRRAAGLWPWPPDVNRHTFATMHFAEHQNLALLKAQLGHHENEATLHRHYRAVRMPDGRAVSRAVAAEFWGLLPAAIADSKKPIAD